MNTHFQFKKFTIQQDKCAMKVCTDACLFGAWVADKLENKTVTATNILDIGSGTGLLALMLAQKTNAHIDAVEINKDAFSQSLLNIQSSPWAEQVTVFNESIHTFSGKFQYDFIVCNPPFFEDHLKSIDENRNAAMHNTTLTFAMLFASVAILLKPQGQLALLIPYHAVDVVKAHLQQHGFFINEQVNVSHSQTLPFIRSILLISYQNTFVEKKPLTIKNQQQQYSDAFVSLLKDYYLYL